MNLPDLAWDEGSAYDLFASLSVLHQPDRFGLRASWAAGVRSRLTTPLREVLESAQFFLSVPLPWIYRLPAPKNAGCALAALAEMPPADRLPTLFFHRETPPLLRQIAERTARQGSYTPQDISAVRGAVGQRSVPFTAAEAAALLNAWRNPAEFGENYLAALQAYVQAFFNEEEQRITPVIEEGLRAAQDLAGRLSLSQLLETLSQGVDFENWLTMPHLVIAPSYWCNPYIYTGSVDADTMLVMFGCRPADTPLVPGDTIPEAALHALKALADPTRLSILRYLAEQPMTPTQLALRLRLRPPTVVHHLHALRLAGLVRVIVENEGFRYAARLEALDTTFDTLKQFLQTD